MTAVSTIASGRGPYTQTHTVLAASAATGMAVTGTTNETTLATVNIPAGLIGNNGILIITAYWTITTSGNNKTVRVRLGAAGAGLSGTAYTAIVQTTNTAFKTQCQIVNRNSQSAQFGDGGNGSGGWAPAASTWVTSSVATSSASQLVLTGQCANSGDTITLESYLVELVRTD